MTQQQLTDYEPPIAVAIAEPYHPASPPPAQTAAPVLVVQSTATPSTILPHYHPHQQQQHTSAHLPQYQHHHQQAPHPQYYQQSHQQHTYTKQVEQHHTTIAFVRDRRGPCYWTLNILWVLLAGWHFFVAWFLAGIVLCCTIVCIPCGIQVLKISWFLLFPFGQGITQSQRFGQCGGCNCCMNAIWMISAGWILSLQAVITGLILCCTIVGIPFGWQCFKLAILCFWPFGLELSPLEVVETTTITTTARPTTAATAY